MFYLLGIGHFYQGDNERYDSMGLNFINQANPTILSCLANDRDDARIELQDLFLKLRSKYRDKLPKLIADRKIVRIFEEGNKGETPEETEKTFTIAKEISKNIAYHQINTAWSERIHKTREEEAANVTNTKENYEERENAWIKAIKKEHKNSDQELLIVGKDHIRNCFNPYDVNFKLDKSLIEKLNGIGIGAIEIIMEKEFLLDVSEYLDLIKCWESKGY